MCWNPYRLLRYVSIPEHNVAEFYWPTRRFYAPLHWPRNDSNLDHQPQSFYSFQMNQMCKVCGEPAAGFHFGAFTCEGCKVSFRSVFLCVSATKRDQGWSSICLVREDVVRGVAFSSTSNWHRFSVLFGIQIKLLSGKKLRIRNDKARARSSEKEKIMWTILYLAMLGPIYLAVITLSRWCMAKEHNWGT